MSDPWNTFHWKLTFTFVDVDAGEPTVLVPDGESRLIQVMWSGDDARAELASNFSLPRDEWWSPEEEERLRSLGWEPPSEANGPNWSQEHIGVRIPLGSLRVSWALNVVIATLREVHGVADPAAVVIGPLPPETPADFDIRTRDLITNR